MKYLSVMNVAAYYFGKILNLILLIGIPILIWNKFKTKKAWIRILFIVLFLIVFGLIQLILLALAYSNYLKT